MGLNATVTPGITVTSSTVLSAANLNLIATPTVSITGSIDSSDIGANTVGTSELIDNAVTQAKIGAIGGANYILRGDSSGNAEGIATLAQDDNSDNQISLLVNDTTDLKPRVITGNLEVTTSGANKLNFAIKDNVITESMLQTNAVQAHIGNIQPGGGLSANGGKASTSQGGCGLIVFDPNTTDTIGDDTYYGKAKVLQPTAANQYLKSTGSGNAPLAFGSITGIPIAYTQAWASENISHTALDVFNNNPFNLTFNKNIHYIRRIQIGSNRYGGLRVFFAEGILSDGDNLGVIGTAITSHNENQPMAFVYDSVGLMSIDSNGDEDTQNGTEHPYVDLVFVNNNGTTTGNPKDIANTYLRNPNVVNLTFYQI